MLLNRKSGFTLVEILVSSVILSIGLVAILTGMSLSRESRLKAEQLNIANAIAQSYIEEYRAKEKTDLSNETINTTSSLLPRGNNITITVSQSENFSASSLSWVRVKITYPEANGTREIYYETCITAF
ncbi:MAG: type II secretion system protein [Armatimonadota bacterium]